MNIRAVAYYRTSSLVNVGEDKHSEKRQRVACSDFAKRYGYSIVSEFYDAGVSGTTPVFKRPAFKELWKYCKGEGIDVIIFEGSDRLARDQFEAELAHRIILKKGFRFASANQPGLYDDDGDHKRKMFKTFTEAIAECERGEIADKLKAARAVKAVENKAKGIVTLAGEGKVGGRKPMRDVNPELINRVKQLHRKRPGQKRMPLRAIAAQLAMEGFVNEKGKAFTAMSISRMVKQ